MQRNSLFKVAAIAAIFALGAEGAYAQKTLKIGTVGRPGIPLGDALEDGLKVGTAKASGGKLLIDAHYNGSICGEQKCGEQANQGLLQMWTSSTANFGNFSTALSIFNLPYIFKDLDSANTLAAGWLLAALLRKADVRCAGRTKTKFEPATIFVDRSIVTKRARGQLELCLVEL